MSITAFIDDFSVVRKILESTDLLSVPERPPPEPLPRDRYEYNGVLHSRKSSNGEKIVLKFLN